MTAPPFEPPQMKFPPLTSSPGVKKWQKQMRERGWHLTADGHYGQISKRICTNFQREHKLAVDGIVGPKTWRATWEEPSTEPPPFPGEALQIGSSGEHVRAWQTQVDRRGWRIGSIDGVYDAESETACSEMQAFLGLDVTGFVDEQTWNAAWLERVPVGI